MLGTSTSGVMSGWLDSPSRTTVWTQLTHKADEQIDVTNYSVIGNYVINIYG